MSWRICRKNRGNILSTDLSLLNLNEGAVVSLNHVVTKNQNLIAGSVGLMSEVEAQNPEIAKALLSAIQAWLGDDRFTALKMAQVFGQAFETGTKKAGFGDLIGQLLLDDQQRANFIQVAHALAESGDLSNLIHALSTLGDSSDLDRTLHFIFDNTSLISLGFR